MTIPAVAFQARPVADSHVVQLYDDDRALMRAVARWVEVVGRGGAAIAICTPDHAAGLREALDAKGTPAAHLEAEGRLVVLDAEATMARFLQDGKINGAAFKRLARGAIRTARASAASPGLPLRLWGEMVNVLWQRGDHLLAHRLEDLWNEIIEETGVELLCSYRVDDLAHEAHEHGHALPQICATHSRLVPAHDAAAFERAVSQALAAVFSPEEAPKLRAVLERSARVRTSMPPAERVLIGLHEMNPEMARRVLAQTRALLAG